MNKKLMSTLLLFAVFAGFLWWGISMLTDPHKDGEQIMYAILILGCSMNALVSLLLLPRKRQSYSNTHETEGVACAMSNQLHIR